jgi:heptosyltransferase I
MRVSTEPLRLHVISLLRATTAARHGMRIEERLRRPLQILLVKTSSLGDVVANLPVVTDILRWRPDARLDWVVEEAFAELVRLHPGVADVIVVAQRRWRKHLLSAAAWSERRAFRTQLRASRYDVVIDTQGLLKSAFIAFRARGTSVGYGWSSAREPLATLAYDWRIAVPKAVHAVERNRRLAARALGYALADPPEYGLRCPGVPAALVLPKACWVALHGTSREEKLWPEERWAELGVTLAARGLAAVLPWGTERERARSERLAAVIPGAVIPPRLALQDLAGLLGTSRFVVGVDTGFTHLAAALSVPVVALFSHSNPALSGVRGRGAYTNLGGMNDPPRVQVVIAAVDALALHHCQTPEGCR